MNIKSFALKVGAIGTPIMALAMKAHAQFTTSTVGSLADEMTNQGVNYIQLFVSKFWVVLLGGAFLVSLAGLVIYIVRKILHPAGK